jgi:hypothetical protein
MAKERIMYWVNHFQKPAVETETYLPEEYKVLRKNKFRDLRGRAFFHSFDEAKDFLIEQAEGKVKRAKKHKNDMELFLRKARQLEEENV